MLADGKEIAREKLEGLIPGQPIDGLQLGQDLNAAVGAYESPFTYNGTIESAVLEVK